MNDAEKKDQLSTSTQLDHLSKFSDDRWREYENKSNAEWKLSYAVWGAILAAVGVLLTESSSITVCYLTLL
jgi:hypothetical protein